MSAESLNEKRIPDRPWLSVVIPTYNGERYVTEALASIEREDTTDIEVIAVDDGSTDSTPEILEQFQARLPLTLIRSKRVGNWTANTNLAMASARGEYLCWLHQDDVWRPGRLKRVREMIDHYPDAAWYFHSSEFISPDGRSVGAWRCPFPQETVVLSAEEIWQRLLVQCFVATCSPVFAAKSLQEVGPLDESLWYSADWDFWLRLSRLGQGVYDPQPWTGFRIHSASQTATRTRDIVEFEKQQRSVLARHLATWQAERGCPSVERLAQLSITVNVALASFTSGMPVNWRAVMADAWRARPWRWWRFLEHSRLWDRGHSRWRLRREFAVQPISKAGQMANLQPQSK